MRTPSFLKGLSLLLFLNLLIKPIWIFFIDRRVQVVVGHEAYGNYFAFFSLTAVFMVLADAGLSSLLNQRIASGSPVDFSRLMKLKILLLFTFVFVCFLAAWLTGVANWQLLAYITIVQAATSLFVFLRAVVSAHQLFTADAWLSVIDKALMILLCAGFLYGVFSGFSLLIFLQLQLLATVIAILVVLVLILKKKLILTSGQNDSYLQILKFLLPFAAIIFFMSLHNRADGYLLQRLHSSREAGIYAAAYRLLDAANVAGYLTASFLLPFIARHSQKKSTWHLVRFTAKNLLIAALAVVAFVSVYSDWVQSVFYHSSDAYLSRIIWIALASLPAYYLIHVYGTVFTAAARFHPFIIVMAAAAFINFSLNLVFIPAHGAAAAAVIAVGSEYIAAFGLMAILAHKNKMLNILSDLAPAAGWWILILVCCKIFYGFQLAPSFALAIISSATIGLLVLQMIYFRKNFISHA